MSSQEQKIKKLEDTIEIMLGIMIIGFMLTSISLGYIFAQLQNMAQ